MPKHILKLLFLSATLAVAPANAGHRHGPMGRSSGEAACPHERARLQALAKAEEQQAAMAPTRVTLMAAVPGEHPLRNVAPGAYFTP